MRAVNLIPSDSRGRDRKRGGIPFTMSHALLGLLAVAVLLVTLYVLTNNTISSRKAKLTALQQQVAQEQAVAAKYTNYANFVKLAQKRIQTVRQIAATRFDWHGVLSDLSKVVPADTSLQVLTATVSPDASAGGSTSGGAGGGSLRSAITAPAFELQGCTKTQDDVARLMSRLRLIDGVTRVSLASTQKQGLGAAGASGSMASGSGNCGNNTPDFDLVVFFQPLPGATSSSSSSTGSTPAATPASTTSTTSTTSSTTTSPSTATPAGGSQ